MTSNQKQGFLCIAFTTLMFSLMEIALKFISGDLNPIQINFSRFLFGGLVLLPFALRKLNHLKAQGVYMEKQDLLYFAFLGFVGTMNFRVGFAGAGIAGTAGSLSVKHHLLNISS